MKNLIVRLIEDDCDLDSIVSLKQARDSENLKPRVSSDEESVTVHEEKLDGADFWIATLNSFPVGYASGSAHGNFYSSDGIYVTPKSRNNGIGLALKLAQVQLAIDKGCTEIFTYVAGDNKSSMRVQEKAGFKFPANPDCGRFYLLLNESA